MSPRFVGWDVQGSAIVAGTEENLRTRELRGKGGGGVRKFGTWLFPTQGGKRKGRMESVPYYIAKCCILQRVLRFKSQQRDPLKRARIQLPSVVYLLSCHKTRHCPSRRYHLRYSHDTISLLRSNYISPQLSLSLSLPPSLSLFFCLSLFLPFLSLLFVIAER